MKKTAAILAIGTEITNGQITNRNAAWLSAELLKLGFITRFHRTVPDEKDLMIDELRELAAKVDLLFVTGGLGPTTDDFTRNCVSEAFGKKLVWHEESWQWIQDRLKERGQPLREFQRQQAYYPEGADVLWNNRGTAHGFSLKAEHLGLPLQKVYVLPGPPLEVEAVYSSGVREDLQKLFPDIDAWMVKSWDCIGVGESELAHRAENALIGCPFEKGYRTHFPLVEFKLSYLSSQEEQAKTWIAKVDEALKDICVLKDFETAAGNLAKALTSYDKIEIFDSATKGEILRRSAADLGSAGVLAKLSTGQIAIEPAEGSSLRLEAHLQDENTAIFSVSLNGKTQDSVVSAPEMYRPAKALDRKLQFFAESAYIAWTRMLSAPRI